MSSASRARSNTCSTSSRRTAPTTRCSATSGTPRAEPIGNGDPSLTIYGENVTPNQHQLARDYVLLDNLYLQRRGQRWTATVGATRPSRPIIKQRSWICRTPGTAVCPATTRWTRPRPGYLWDLCRRNGVSFRNYGEGAKRVPSANRGTWRGGRDMDRVQGWIEDLHVADASGDLPRFTIMSLGENHTRGTTPGAFTPEACVASNDLGLARIVEAASRSKFWKQMAIFVIEDDAQNGPDHVDAHRTVGFVISPYCKRGVVDSTLYTTASMIRTMELILGLPPLTQYDAGATPMFNCFQKTCQATPFTVRTPDGESVCQEHQEIALRQGIRPDEFPRLRPRAGRRTEPDPMVCRPRHGRSLPDADPSDAVFQLNPPARAGASLSFCAPRTSILVSRVPQFGVIRRTRRGTSDAYA